ncbi:hypothetical protein tinsulaeT_02760 [Thalassotalea insulae]|uniref:RND family efflux transporter MFP subunit n=1 Tax=Thalassotalea insulae TaxID=2056778 RepID=A0ABQ6GQG5_9GAMM|nr:efflux RND transporter periplasmic adaptor subunit [Thalassotalea insulae]GLX76936.1 hypothetical protein tinsulaeT_02760 [Thalassotalea insulae]
MKTIFPGVAIWRALIAVFFIVFGSDASGFDNSHLVNDNTIDHQVSIQLSKTQQQLANIKVAKVKPALFPYVVYAPGEIKVNGYASYLVSPRTESVVVRRHAILGDHVVNGQALVTLFSASIAEAQADYRIALSEWQRVSRLAKEAISEKVFVNAEIAFNAAYGRLLALGLTKQAVNELATSEQLGQYTLVAQSDGVILADDFIDGQRVDAGEAIMVVANEQTLWVEANLPANTRDNFPVGTLAEIAFAQQKYQAKVIQQTHTIDAVTRTRRIRLAVENIDDQLHAGMFVDVNFQLASDMPIVALPENSFVRDQHGDWSVFIALGEEQFSMQEVSLGRELNGYRQVLNFPEHSRVVIEGAFFIAAQIAKAGFDTHNH